MRKIYLYAHGGSGNHGCEAIVRSTVALLREWTKEHLYLISSHPEEDSVYGIDSLCTILPEKTQYPKCSVEFLSAYLRLKLKQDYIPLDKLEYKKAFDYVQKDDIALSIGGDNYCYADVQRYIMMHDMMLKRGAKTVLWGCSVDPKLVEKTEIAKDLARYSFITARESLSYEALRRVNPNTVLVPDPAFTLQYTVPKLPANFIKGNMVGINISPMVVENEIIPGITMKNYQALIDYILTKTDMGVALIPHVIWQGGDDRIPLRTLYDQYKDSNRIVMVEDHNCMELKGLISCCRFFVGARTHATIAAYSTGVPTLVIGYSVKARGIAKDLFGTEDGFVFPVQMLSKSNELVANFTALVQKEKNIKQCLQKDSLRVKYNWYTDLKNNILSSKI